ncbi:ABC transporter ATP-binding protein [Helicobacter sp. MIT 14-3879]|uniref:ABC transporter ATP-binding protein n=1 Tax=Helicobacter sp. MIT 14-3879 TaxID=2040649 RepID=UPI000E1E9722|nr:ABC transporter ATP-binding protein [Helicobacter sp. MIT 14-3879]RDU65245.1 ABC transporter ATP-binding protein [Helicobacter sp. MIT 14-3879]
MLLQNINLVVKNGDFFGILGANGCGKSTLLKNILGFLKPKSGIIKILDNNIENYSIKDLAKIIGFVPQKSAITTPLKTIDVLLMGKYAMLEQYFISYSKDDYENVENIAEMLNISEFLYRNILSLSGGEFQRVLLARAMLKNPKILLLDEPTSALDLNYAIELLSICKEKFNNICVVVVLHDLNLASLFCNKIVFLKKGKNLYQGGVKELFTKDILKDVYDLNCDVIKHNNLPFILPRRKNEKDNIINII